MSQVIFKSVQSIADSNPLDMPVHNIDTTAVWYEMHLQFRVSSRDGNKRTLRMVRDNVTIQLAENGRDPEAESCYIEVNDVDAAFEELQRHQPETEEITEEEVGGVKCRVFFIRDPNGLSYCLGQKSELA